MTQSTAELVIRELTNLDEMKRSEDFQREVWGQDDPADNADLMLALQHEGGLVAGAFVESRMLGFLFAFPTSEQDTQHSHRLAVHIDSRGLGLGRKLKWFQRDWCLSRGIKKVRWTYDPLRRINAGLNIAHLGATAGIYHTDYYGKMEGINAGVASDRLLAEWDLHAADVTERAAGKTPRPSQRIEMRVAIPTDFGALLSHDLSAAVAERERVREILTTAFSQGLRITGFDTESCEYLLEIPKQQ